MENFDKEALKYHAEKIPGKVDVCSSKDVSSEYALSLAYSPGVAAPCLEIAKDPAKAFEYTTKGNLVAVITNGTAVLGLGDIGPLAGKPVMEGKGVLFKKFANINVFDIEIDEKDPEKFINIVKSLEPTFGGINLEDISAPQCFEIEKRLREEMNIPVFHDDQHGTAIITGAALINACFLTDKKLEDVKVVFNGAGAAAISCARLVIDLGVKRENLIMCDSKGVINTIRKDLNEMKKEFANPTTAVTLADALEGADAFIGLSIANILDESMLKSMANNPIIFAMANPSPEVDPAFAKEIRPDAIIATGRSDYPNQVNNVLGFPYIFRGALDVRATEINEAMKIAAVHALADLARQTVTDEVTTAYKDQDFHFGPNYIIPKPFDSRVLLVVAPAVAKAAMESGVAQIQIPSMKQYREKLERLLGETRGFIRPIINRVKKWNKKSTTPKIVLPEGNSRKVLKAVQQVLEEGFAEIIILGDRKKILARAQEDELPLIEKCQIFRPTEHPEYKMYVREFFELRKRKGLLHSEASLLLEDPYYFSAMMVRLGEADGLVSGASQNYASCVKPLLEVIGRAQSKVASGVNIVLKGDQKIFLADTTMMIDPTAEQLAQVALDVSEFAESYGVKPKVAMLSYTSFKAQSEGPKKMQKAAQLTKALRPDLPVDGEVQADAAINPDIMSRLFSFSELKDGANVLIFPNLEAANISYKLIQQLIQGEVIGPILLGMNQPSNIIQRTGGVQDLINAIAMTAHESHERKTRQHANA